MSKKKYESTKRYNETAEMYDRRYKSIQFSKYREVFPEVEISDSDLILDIGGGTGLLVEYLNKQQANIVVCDLSLEMLKIGKQKHPRGNFICLDSENLPFRDTCSNIICFFSIFQNLESPTLSLQEGFRILQSSGRVIITALSKIFEEEELTKKMRKNKYKIEKSWFLPVEDLAIIGKKRTREYSK